MVSPVVGCTTRFVSTTIRAASPAISAWAASRLPTTCIRSFTAAISARAASRLPTTCIRSVTAAQHLHVSGVNFRAIVGLPVPFVGSCSQFTLDVALRSLLQVLSTNLRQSAKTNDVVPLRAFVHLARTSIAPSSGRGDAEICHRLAALSLANFWVAPQVSNQHHLVEGHGCRLAVQSGQVQSINGTT